MSRHSGGPATTVGPTLYAARPARAPAWVVVACTAVCMLAPGAGWVAAWHVEQRAELEVSPPSQVPPAAPTATAPTPSPDY